MRGRGSLVAAIALAAAAPVAAQPLSPTAFRDRYASALRMVFGRATVVVDDKTFRTTAADGTDLTIHIDNAYVQYLAAPGEIDAIIARHIAVLTANNGPRTEPIDQLVVIVRPTDYIRSNVAPGASLGHFIAPRPMAGDLSFFLAVDSPEAIRTASDEDLKRWKVYAAGAWRRAIANIKARVGALTMVHLGGADGPAGFAAESGLAPSILADPAICGAAAPNGLTGRSCCSTPGIWSCSQCPATRP